MRQLLTMIIESAITRAAVYAASGYLIAHGITGAHSWVEAGLAAALAVLGLIHAGSKPSASTHAQWEKDYAAWQESFASTKPAVPDA